MSGAFTGYGSIQRSDLSIFIGWLVPGPESGALSDGRCFYPGQTDRHRLQRPARLGLLGPAGGIIGKQGRMPCEEAPFAPVPGSTHGLEAAQAPASCGASIDTSAIVEPSTTHTAMA
jgi:hypothetical protein